MDEKCYFTVEEAKKYEEMYRGFVEFRKPWFYDACREIIRLNEENAHLHKRLIEYDRENAELKNDIEVLEHDTISISAHDAELVRLNEVIEELEKELEKYAHLKHLKRECD